MDNGSLLIGLAVVLGIGFVWVRLALYTWTLLRNPDKSLWITIALLVVYLPYGALAAGQLLTGRLGPDVFVIAALNLFTVHIVHIALLIVVGVCSALFGWMFGRRPADPQATDTDGQYG